MFKPLLDHPLFQAVLVMILTLIGKKIWDRWLSKTSRITEDKCKDNQALCLAKVTTKIEEIHTEVTSKIDAVRNTLLALDEIRGFHTTTTHAIRLIMLTLSEICANGDTCEETTRELIRQELMK